MVEAKTKIERYESYRDSGIEWLGEIPKHWKIESFKHILTERNEKNAPIRTKEILSLSIDKGVTLYAEKTTNLDRFKDDFSKYKLAHKGDLVFNSMNMIVGAVGVSDYFGCVSPVYYTYYGELNNSDTSKFYEYLFRSKIVQGVLYSLGKGLMAIDRGDGKYNTLRLKVSRDDLRSMKLPFPNPSEQTKIVQFLNDKTTKIEDAIAIKEQQINLLKERKQILIHKAVTRGLDDSVTLKDSCVEWIGEIPEHWEVKRFRYVFNLGKGLTITKDNLREEGVFCVNYGEIHSKYGFELDTNIHKLKCVDEDYLLNNPSALINYGDFVFADTSEDIEGSGNFTYLESKDEIFAGYHTVVAKPKFEIESRFFAYIFESESFRNQIRTKVKGVKVFSITQSILKQPTVWYPSKNEQKEIVDYLDSGTKKIETAIGLKQQEIDKLKEYKSSLINGAVTGKVRVC
ncbi:restriction endonuclease subunit S [Lacinutrix himadriensis]|uniref:restriction endonuclease subunit S n=1 Tax=Lacinutrix himadriensis TaxID=641549 RepID=UPI0006E1EE09|nr:restriction endonuclease subunit S [Lacinutrix himadriensis]